MKQIIIAIKAVKLGGKIGNVITSVKVIILKFHVLNGDEWVTNKLLVAMPGGRLRLEKTYLSYSNKSY